MKGKNGFISMFVLIISLVLFTMIAYLAHISYLGDSILIANHNNIQAYYSAESKVLMAIFDDKYYKDNLYDYIYKSFRYNSFSTSHRIYLDPTDLMETDKKYIVQAFFTDDTDRRSLLIKTESNYKKLLTKMEAFVSLVNEFFELGEPLLSLATVDVSEMSDLARLMKDIRDNISFRGHEGLDNFYLREYEEYNDIILVGMSDKNYEIQAYRPTMTHPYVERFKKDHIFLICRNRNNEPLTLSLGQPDKPEAVLKAGGILFVQGDLKINCNFDFSGIIIVMDGQIHIDGPSRPVVRGLLIADNVLDLEEIKDKIDLQFNPYYIDRYGILLPGFLEPNIYLIKSN